VSFPLWPFVIVIMAAFLRWGFFMWRMVDHGIRLPDPPWYVRWNPVNIMLRPDLWDDAARRDGRRCLVSFAVFVGTAAVAFMVAVVLAMFRT
jgi:hypothetical protein